MIMREFPPPDAPGMVAGGRASIASATNSIAIGTNVRISSSAENAVAVSAYTSKSCATTEPGSLTLCADKNVTIECSALVVNGVDVVMTTSDLKAELLDTKAELLNTKAELADLKAKVAALMLTPKPTTKPTTKAPTAPTTKAPTVERGR
jgi:hypothetical protein